MFNQASALSVQFPCVNIPGIPSPQAAMAAMKAVKAPKIRDIKNHWAEKTLVRAKAPKAKAKAVPVKAMKVMKAMQAMKAPKAKAKAVPIPLSSLEGQVAVMRQAIVECDERLITNVKRRATDVAKKNAAPVTQ